MYTNIGYFQMVTQEALEIHSQRAKEAQKEEGWSTLSVHGRTDE